MRRCSATLFEVMPVERLVGMALLALILSISLWARVSVTNYALPYVGYHPDEYAVADEALGMLRTGDFDIRHHPGPKLQVYLQAAVGKLVLWYSSATGNTVTAHDILLTGDRSASGGIAGIPEYFSWGRITVALMGSLTVLLVYAIASSIYGQPAGLIAAAFLALAPLHERDSRWLTTAVPVTFLITFSFTAMVMFVRHQRRWLLLAAFVLAGLAIYTKSNGRVVLVPILLVSAYYVLRGSGRRIARLALIAAGLLLLALLSAPFVGGGSEVLQSIPDYVLRPIWENGYVYGGTHAGADGPAGWEPTVKMLTADEWRYVAVLSLFGALWLLVRKPTWTALVASIPIANFVVFSFFTVRFDRWLLPMLPFMAVLSGAFLWDFAARLLARFTSRRYAAPVICSVVAVSLLWGSGVEIHERHLFLAAGDPRTAASEWMAATLEPGSKIATEAYSPFISIRDFRVEEIGVLVYREFDWYRREGFTYAVTSSGAYGRFMDDRSKYADQVTRYEALFKEFPIIKEFSGAGPTIRILKVDRGHVTASMPGDSR